MKSWCERLYLDKKDFCLVEKYYKILTENNPTLKDYQIKCNALISIHIAARILRFEEEVFSLENLSNFAA